VLYAKSIILLILFTIFAHSNIFIKPYFSQTSGRYYKKGVDRYIIRDIDSATLSIDMAMYLLTNRYITKALIDAHNRGVKVRVVTDDKKSNSKRYRELKRAGIVVQDDGDSRALMHNKILIIDHQITWISSGNYTVYAFYRNHDNFLRIDKREISKYYRDKFSRLYSGDGEPVKPYLSKNLEIYFAPDMDIQKRLLARINHAKDSIYFLAYAFTNQQISKALVAAHNRGVDVKGVFDKAQNNYQKYSQYRYLKSKGIPVKLDKNRYKLHHKVMIIDSKTVVVGSYNFTHRANNANAENVIIIKDSDIASQYIGEFEKIYR
jgi:phosphatidylserine/phosphatidylglycerophosphate/cardiolipin synthase-like enzyme